MSATSGSALKAFLESQGLGIAAYRRKAPRDEDGNLPARPYVVITERISQTAEVAFNQYDDPQGHVAERVQISVFQDAASESPTLVDAIAQAVKGASLPTAPTYVSGVELANVITASTADPALLHDVVEVVVRRTLERKPA